MVNRQPEEGNAISHTIDDRAGRSLVALGARFLAAAVAVAAGFSLARAADPQPAVTAAKALMAKYANSDDTDALLREPAVRTQLQKLLGPQLATLEWNLSVRGSVDVIGGALSLSGNAPHAGTEEEAVVCVAPIGPIGPVVQAAIYSKGRTTVFASEGSYDFLFRCIKDWITQVKSQHVDRFEQPANVRVLKPRLGARLTFPARPRLFG